MDKYLPGTVIEVPINGTGVSRNMLGNIFLTGGLALSQVSRLLGVETHVVQNWVRRGFVSPPVKKVYTRRQFCRLALINMLKESFKLERIASLISYLNGKLDDESDDSVSDEALYDYYADMLWLAENTSLSASEAAKKAAEEYVELAADGKAKLVKALEVMYHAHKSAILKARADTLLNAIEQQEGTL